VAVVQEQLVLVSQLLELLILAVEAVVDTLELLIQFQVSFQMLQVAQESLLLKNHKANMLVQEYGI